MDKDKEIKELIEQIEKLEQQIIVTKMRGKVVSGELGWPPPVAVGTHWYEGMRNNAKDSDE